MSLYNVKCINITKGWFSFYTHTYTNMTLNSNQFCIIPNVPEEKLSYYESYSRLGLAISYVKVEDKNLGLELNKEESEVVEENKEPQSIEKRDNTDIVYEGLSKAQIQDILRGLGVDFKGSETKAQLIARIVKLNESRED